VAHGVDLASNKNGYYGYLLRYKGSRSVVLATLPPSCTECLKILVTSTSWKTNGLYRPTKG